MTEDCMSVSIESELIEKYGHLLNMEALRKTLAFPTVGALQQSINRGSLEIPIFSIENRKGKFALAKDVAKWLVNQREKSLKEVNHG